MVPCASRIFYPPPIRNQTPAGVFRYDPSDGFRHIVTPTRRGLYATSDIAISVDGACMNNGSYDACAGMGVYFGRNSWRNFNQELLYGPATSQRAEIRAAIIALKKVKNYAQNQDLPDDARNIVLVADSNYLVESMTCWIDYWRETGWITRSGARVRNYKDFEVLDDLIEEMEDEYGLFVLFWHVDRSWNQGADREAKRAIGIYY